MNERDDEIEQLQTAVAHRDVIGQAKGILMERHQLSAEQAWARLVTASQEQNRKLYEIAAEIASTGVDVP